MKPGDFFIEPEIQAAALGPDDPWATPVGTGFGQARKVLVLDSDVIERLRRSPLEEVPDREAAYGLIRLAWDELREYGTSATANQLDNEQIALVLRTLKVLLNRLSFEFSPPFYDFESFGDYWRSEGMSYSWAARRGYLRELFRPILAQIEDAEDATSIRGVDGELKNVIFASSGYKPRIVLRDAINNVVEVTRNAHTCLFYDRPLGPSGLTWRDLIDWWRSERSLVDANDEDVGRDLYKRLCASLGSEPEGLLLQTYCTYFPVTPAGALFPALLPQVYLHYDPSTRLERQRAGEDDVLERERMDFLMLLPNGVRIVLEVDGQQHYGVPDPDDHDGHRYIATPRLYSDMVAEDRRLRLAGYEVYRFGGHELTDDKAAAKSMLRTFFFNLLGEHGVVGADNTQGPLQASGS
ncbi:hypothetical protein AB0C84_15830 [Actinomadura sp. NPDC048955]|uniref:hypothetical protein n=1 Tax=Actinomadura sp. NPDC048955 TaxID=3158228 RepID=UPI003404727E